MTDYTDLIARLRNAYVTASPEEAADALEEKDRRIAELRKEADMMHSEYKTAAARIAELEAERERLASKFDSKPNMLWSGEAVAYELRAARAALENKND